MCDAKVNYNVATAWSGPVVTVFPAPSSHRALQYRIFWGSAGIVSVHPEEQAAGLIVSCAKENGERPGTVQRSRRVVQKKSVLEPNSS